MLTEKIKPLPDESCPGLREWITCKYIPFGEDQTDSKIGRICIGNYTSCPRYLEQVAQSSPSCTLSESRKLLYSLQPATLQGEWEHD